MPDTNRRRFLATAGAGAATAGAIALVPGIADAATPTASAVPTAAVPTAELGPIVAHLEDIRTGVISVMVGERAVTLRDPAIAAALARAVGA